MTTWENYNFQTITRREEKKDSWTRLLPTDRNMHCRYTIPFLYAKYQNIFRWRLTRPHWNCKESVRPEWLGCLRGAVPNGLRWALISCRKEEEPVGRYLRGGHLPDTSYQWTDGLLCHVLVKGTRTDTLSFVCAHKWDATQPARTEVGKLWPTVFQCLWSRFSKELNTMKLKLDICCHLTLKHMLKYPIIYYFLLRDGSQNDATHLLFLWRLCQILKAVVAHLSKGLPTPGLKGQKYV